MRNEDIFGVLLGAAMLAAALYMYFKDQRKAGQEQKEQKQEEQKQEEQTGSVGTSPESILVPYDRDILPEPPKTTPYYPPSEPEPPKTTPYHPPSEPKITSVYAPPSAEVGKDFTITVTGTNLKGKNLTIVTSASEIYGIQISKSMNADSERITIPLSKIRPELYPMIRRSSYLKWNAGFVIRSGTKELYRFSVPVQPTKMMTYANSMCRIEDVRVYGEYDKYHNSVTINKIDLIFSYVKYPFQLLLPSQRQERTIGGWVGLDLGSMSRTGEQYYDGHGIYVEVLTKRPDALVKSEVASGGKTLKDLESSKKISIPVNRKFYIRQQPVIWLNIHYRYLDANGNAKDFHNYWMKIDLTNIAKSGKVIISEIYLSPLISGYVPLSVYDKDILPEPPKTTPYYPPYEPPKSAQKIMNSIRNVYINVLGSYTRFTSAELIVEYNPSIDAPSSFIATIKATAEVFKSGNVMDYSVKLNTKTFTAKIVRGINRIPIYLKYSDSNVVNGDPGAISVTIYYNDEKVGYATKYVKYITKAGGPLPPSELPQPV